MALIIVLDPSRRISIHSCRIFNVSKKEYKSKKRLLNLVIGESDPTIHVDYDNFVWKEIFQYSELFGGALKSISDQCKKNFIVEQEFDVPLSLANVIFQSWETDPSIGFRKEYYRPLKIQKDGSVVIINVKEI